MEKELKNKATRNKTLPTCALDGERSHQQAKKPATRLEQGAARPMNDSSEAAHEKKRKPGWRFQRRANREVQPIEVHVPASQIQEPNS